MTETYDVPNLDGLVDVNEMWKISQKLNRKGTASKLFPDHPKGYRAATRDLSHYAAHKSTAMQLRLNGEISRAQIYEHICNNIYDNLQDYAKW